MATVDPIPRQIPTAKVARRLGVSRETVVRYTLTGVTVNGQRVRLAGFKRGRSYFYTPRAVRAFLAATSVVADGPAVPGRAHPRTRSRDEEAAWAYLESQGIRRRAEA